MTVGLMLVAALLAGAPPRLLSAGIAYADADLVEEQADGFARWMERELARGDVHVRGVEELRGVVGQGLVSLRGCKDRASCATQAQAFGDDAFLVMEARGRGGVLEMTVELQLADERRPLVIEHFRSNRLELPRRLEETGRRFARELHGALERVKSGNRASPIAHVGSGLGVVLTATAVYLQFDARVKYSTLTGGSRFQSSGEPETVRHAFRLREEVRAQQQWALGLSALGVPVLLASLFFEVRPFFERLAREERLRGSLLLTPAGVGLALAWP